jgi:hypothetical protein
MQNLKKGVKTCAILFVGITCGGIVGLALGVAVVMGLVYWTQLTHPNDPSAGSVAILVIFTAPAGAMVGATVGGVCILTRPRLFLMTILPLAIFFVGLEATLSTLRRMDRPRNFVVEVMGTQGAEFAGVAFVDGQMLPKQGILPATYEFEAYRMELALALVRPNEQDNISVNVSADGRELKTGIESDLGVYLQLKSIGYSETFGGTSMRSSRMSQDEVNRLFNNQALPNRLRL